MSSKVGMTWAETQAGDLLFVASEVPIPGWTSLSGEHEGIHYKIHTGIETHWPPLLGIARSRRTPDVNSFSL
jgi:hypothetical protein